VKASAVPSLLSILAVTTTLTGVAAGERPARELEVASAAPAVMT